MDSVSKIHFTDSDKGAETYDLMPSYSETGIQYLYTNLFHNKEQIIADIGSGTGRLANQLLKGNILYCVEPDPKMRKIAENKLQQYYNFNSIDGYDAQTMLKDSSVDFIVVGQAFHRFNVTEFRKEADRILKKPDNVIILWNRINYSNPILKDMLSVLKACYKSYSSRFECDNEEEGSIIEANANNQSASDFYHSSSKLLTFPNNFVLSEQKFFDICMSLWIFPLSNGNESESILISSDFDSKKFKALLTEIFDTHQINGTITLPLKTDIHIPKYTIL